MALPGTVRASVSSPRLDEFRLRNFLDKLERHGELIYNDDPVELIDVARLLESEPKAICFRNIGGKGEQLVGNVMATRKRLALAFDISERDLLSELKQRLTKPIAPVEVASADAPVHQVVWEGKDIDLARLPIHLQHSLDGAPYISSSLDFSTEPGTGRTNVGCRRIMPLGRAIASVDMNAPSDFRAAFLKLSLIHI